MVIAMCKFTLNIQSGFHRFWKADLGPINKHWWIRAERLGKWIGGLRMEPWEIWQQREEAQSLNKSKKNFFSITRKKYDIYLVPWGTLGIPWTQHLSGEVSEDTEIRPPVPYQDQMWNPNLGFPFPCLVSLWSCAFNIFFKIACNLALFSWVHLLLSCMFTLPFLFM